MRAFIWDLDGTLLDSYGVITSSAVDALKEYGIPADPEELLNQALERFISRFDKIEREAADRGKTTNELSPGELADCWKNKER